jgi:hypothetical protein
MPGVGSYHLVFPLAFILLLLRFFLRKKITIPAPGSDQQSDRAGRETTTINNNRCQKSLPQLMQTPSLIIASWTGCVAWRPSW